MRLRFLAISKISVDIFRKSRNNMTHMKIRSKTILVLMALLNGFFVAIMIHSQSQVSTLRRDALVHESTAIASMITRQYVAAVDDNELLTVKKAIDAYREDQKIVYIFVRDGSGRVVATTDRALHAEGIPSHTMYREIRLGDSEITSVAVPIKMPDKKVGTIYFGFDGGVLTRVSQSQALKGFMMFLALNLISILVLQLLVPVLTRPINELIAITKKIRNKEFSFELTRRSDEFAELEKSFYEMGKELGETIEDLTNKNDFFSSFRKFYIEAEAPYDVKDAKKRVIEHINYLFKHGLAVIGVTDPDEREIDLLVGPVDYPYAVSRKRLLELVNEVIVRKSSIRHPSINLGSNALKHAALFMPLETDNEVYGAVGVLSLKPLTDNEVSYFELVTKVANVLMNLTIFLRASKEQARRLKDLYTAGHKINYSVDTQVRIREAAEQTKKIFNFKRVSFFLKLGSSFERFESPCPVPGELNEVLSIIKQTRRARVHQQKLFVAPLEIKDEVTGYLLADNDGRVIHIENVDAGLLNIFLHALAVSFHNVQLFSELSAKCNELAGVYDISNSFSLTKNRETIFGEMVEKIARLAGATKILIALYDQETHEMAGQLPGHGVPAESVRQFRFKINEASVAKTIFGTGKPYYTNNILADPAPLQRFVKLFDLKTLMAVPLTVKGEMLGVLYAADKVGNRPFTEGDIGLFTIFANQAATVIENIKLYDDMKRHIRDLAILNEIQQQLASSLELNDVLQAVVGVVRDKLGYELCGIGLYEEYSQEIVAKAWSGYEENVRAVSPTRLGQGIVGNAALVAEPILVPDVSKDESYIETIPGVRSELAIPIKSRGKLVGILDIESKELNAFTSHDVDFLKTVAYLAGMAIDNALMHHELEIGFIETVKALVIMIDAKDPYTRGHSERVMVYATKIAERVDLSEEEVKRVKYAALLHDIGKIGISEAILAKPAQLTQEEMDEVRLHPLLGAQMLDEIKNFQDIRFLIRSHHENVNGAGYPYGIKGDAIPLGARIIAVADTFEALISDRPYRPAFSRTQAIAILKESAGVKLDAELVEVFLKIVKEEELEAI